MTDAGNFTPQPIVIAGFMGSGKTTAALALAELLHCNAIDLDHLITETEKRTPREIIEQDGEAAFRKVETRRLREVLGLASARVIALGGGAWTLKWNRELIAEYGGLTVWLDAPFDLCWERITAAGDERPLAPDEAQALQRYEARRKIYALAQLRVQVGRNTSVDEVAKEIASKIHPVE